jgi:hypothetical protein
MRTSLAAGRGHYPVWLAQELHAAAPCRKNLYSKAALEGERKQVTVLFADIKGSMELLADRDAEAAQTLLFRPELSTQCPARVYSYTFDGARLVTKLDAASDPAGIASEQPRGVRFQGTG